MNIIKSFNNTIDYLETVLDDEIDEKKVTQLSGYSYSMFSRLFSILFLPKRLHLFRHFLICQQIFHQMSNAPVSLLSILSTPHNHVFHTIYFISTVTGFNGYSILMSPHENV